MTRDFHRCAPNQRGASRRRAFRRAFVGAVGAAFLVAVTTGSACEQRKPNVDPVFAPGGVFALNHLREAGGAPVSLLVRDGLIERRFNSSEVPADAAADVVVVDGEDLFITPALIDSHVHFRFLDGAVAFADLGFGAAVDLASPVDFLESKAALPLTVVAAGPMITPVNGYPTQSWGRAGYGLEVDSPAAAVAATVMLANRGAGVIKIPMDGTRGLDDDTAKAVVDAAHARGLRVAAHALSAAGAARAAIVGVDVLAHAPAERLSDETIALWGDRTVVGTLSAFGNAGAENLERLHAAGATILYGTDFGNSQTVGLSPTEVAFLAAAGLGPSDILAALTSAPANFWGLDDLGAIADGKRATFLLTEVDPLEDPLALTRPTHVVRRGQSIP